MSSGLSPFETFREAEGRTTGSIVQQGIAAWMLSIFLSLIAGFQSVFEFLFLPFELLIDVAVASVDAFILTPFGLTRIGFIASARAILANFGLAGLPVSIVIALVSLLIVLAFLQLPITSNILPGLFIDNRLVEFFFTTPEEEAEGED